MITDILYSILSGTYSNCYPLVAPQDAVLPYITINPTTTEPSTAKNSAINCITYYVNINVYAASVRQAQQIMNGLKALLHNYSGTYDVYTIEGISYISEAFSFDEVLNGYQITGEFKVRVKS